MKYMSSTYFCFRWQVKAENAPRSLDTPPPPSPGTWPLGAFVLAYHASHKHSARVKRTSLATPGYHLWGIQTITERKGGESLSTIFLPVSPPERPLWRTDMHLPTETCTRTYTYQNNDTEYGTKTMVAGIFVNKGNKPSNRTRNWRNLKINKKKCIYF